MIWRKGFRKVTLGPELLWATSGQRMRHRANNAGMADSKRNFFYSNNIENMSLLQETHWRMPGSVYRAGLCNLVLGYPNQGFPGSQQFLSNVCVLWIHLTRADIFPSQEKRNHLWEEQIAGACAWVIIPTDNRSTFTLCPLPCILQGFFHPNHQEIRNRTRTSWLPVMGQVLC